MNLNLPISPITLKFDCVDCGGKYEVAILLFFILFRSFLLLYDQLFHLTSIIIVNMRMPMLHILNAVAIFPERRTGLKTGRAQ